MIRIWPSEYTPFFQVFGYNYFGKTSSKGKLGAYFMKSIETALETATNLLFFTTIVAFQNI
jgi:hypothetical protein